MPSSPERKMAVWSWRVQEEDAHWPVPELCVPPPQTSEARSCHNALEQVWDNNDRAGGEEGWAGTPERSLKCVAVHPQTPAGTSTRQGRVSRPKWTGVQTPCTNCGAECIGETGRQLKTWLDEHRKEVQREIYKEREKITITDLAMTETHTIDWEGAKSLIKSQTKELDK